MSTNSTLTFKWVVAFQLILFACSLQAQVIESWECTTSSYDATVLIVGNIDDGRKTGSIEVAGVIHKALFEIRGFNRKWYFGLSNDGIYDFTFSITPNGSGRYYDFSNAGAGETVEPVGLYKCQIRK